VLNRNSRIGEKVRIRQEKQVEALLSAEPQRGNREAVQEGSYGRFLYNYFRYYDPSIGRYVSADPIGQFGLVSSAFGVSVVFPGAGSNVYKYSYANPVNLSDPTGTLVPLAAAAVATAKALGLGTAIGLGGATFGFGLAGALDFLFGGEGEDGSGDDPCPPEGSGEGFFGKNLSDFANALGAVAAINAGIAAGVTGVAVAAEAGPAVAGTAIANAHKVPGAAAVVEAAVTTGPGGSTPTAQAVNAVTQSMRNLRSQIRRSFGR
jgi:RHS repeat-associated protein